MSQIFRGRWLALHLTYEESIAKERRPHCGGYVQLLSEVVESIADGERLGQAAAEGIKVERGLLSHEVRK